VHAASDAGAPAPGQSGLSVGRGYGREVRERRVNMVEIRISMVERQVIHRGTTAPTATSRA
jgi:hypothetical protein